VVKRPVRQRAIARLRTRLLRRGAPRLEMGLIVSAAASIGLLSSIGLLWLGLHTMWLRYAISACAGYSSFLGLVWVWLPPKRGRMRDGPGLGEVADVLDIADPVGLVQSGAEHVISSLPAEAPASAGDVGILDVDLGLDELVVVVAVGAAIVAGLVAVGYVVVIAPSFFAEVLADGAISYGLYRRVRGLERQHWIWSAVSHTHLPFLAVVLFLALAGAAMQWYTPSADSIGDVWLSGR
jgi:hypothetical protein